MIAPSHDIDLDAGPRAQELERMCVATRTVRPVADMIRFVIGPDGEAVPDLKRKLPGRGVWVTATQDALSEALKRKALARGFKRDVRLPAIQKHRLRCCSFRKRCATGESVKLGTRTAQAGAAIFEDASASTTINVMGPMRSRLSFTTRPMPAVIAATAA